MSGQIASQGMMSVADLNRQTMTDLGSNIGNALTTIGAVYGQMQGTKAKGKNFKKFMGMAGETFGMDGSMFADMEDYDAGLMLDNFGSWMPAMANAQLGKQRIGVQQGASAARAQYNAASQVSSGQGRVTAPSSNINFGVIP
jgi:hypothetical protein